MKKTLLHGLLYFLFIQGSVLLAIPFNLLCQLIVSLNTSPSSVALRLIVCGCFGMLTEFMLCVFFFSRRRVNNKRDSRRDFLLPCAFAVPAHALFAALTGCYPYIAGYAVSDIGQLIGWSMAGDFSLLYPEIPYYAFLMILPITTGVKFLSIWVGYLLGDRILKRERQDILGGKDRPS